MALGAVGCGGGGSSSSTSTPATTATATTQARRSPAKSAGQGTKTKQGSRPKAVSASPEVKELERQFPQPKPTAGLAGAATALEAGKRACQGKTPLQVKEEFISAARANLSSEQMELISKLASYQRRSHTDPSFAAGQLGATVYSMSLPESQQSDGFKGCVYELAQKLTREISGSQ